MKKKMTLAEKAKAVHAIYRSMLKTQDMIAVLQGEAFIEQDKKLHAALTDLRHLNDAGTGTVLTIEYNLKG